MVASRQDAWTEDDDLVLAEVTLRHIREGGTQLAACEEVGQRLGRTAAACGFRWNSCVRKRYDAAISIAKSQRQQLKKMGRIQAGRSGRDGCGFVAAKAGVACCFGDAGCQAGGSGGGADRIRDSHARQPERNGPSLATIGTRVGRKRFGVKRIERSARARQKRTGAGAGRKRRLPRPRPDHGPGSQACLFAGRGIRQSYFQNGRKRQSGARGKIDAGFSTEKRSGVQSASFFSSGRRASLAAPRFPATRRKGFRHGRASDCT